MTVTTNIPVSAPAEATGTPGPITEMISAIKAAAVPGTIERLEGSTVLENQFIRVDTDTVRFPNGTLGQYSVVTSGSGLGVLTIPFVNFRGIAHVGLVRQYRYPTGEFTLEFPRGGSDDLTLDEAARELIEETGLDYSSAALLGTIRPDTGILTTEVAVWKTFHGMEHLRPGHVEDETGAKIEWYSHGQLLGMIRNGKITCGMTLAALGLLTAGGNMNCP
ncbi:NUDIX hydrolase [Arthrobacter sp. UYCo732]|uniref:NUDIX hydrolase n=1 Tax=Arthrobacter sp. UYCo732 TaxID=3156336 RepID=UPI0033951E37